MNENELYPPTPSIEVNEVKPGIEISPELNPNPEPSKNRTKYKIIGGLVGLLVILGAVGYGSYSQGYSVKGLSVLSPSKIWDRFYTGESDEKMYNAKFSMEYTDPESYEDPNNDLGIVLKNIKLNIDGDTYADFTDTTSPEFDGNLNFSVSSGNTSFSSGVEFRSLNKKIFYKVGDIPFLSGIAGPENKDVEWVMVDIDKAAADQSSADAELFKKIIDPAFEEKMRQIWLDNRAIKIKKYVGRDKVNDARTLHFKAELDKEATKKALMESLMGLASLDENVSWSDDDKELVDAFFAKLLSKIEVKELDVWVGSEDYNLYKMHLVSNAPSFVSIIKLFSEEFGDFSTADVNSIAKQKKEMETFMDKIKFTGTFRLDATYSDYGQKKVISEPQGAFDLLGDALGKAADAKRLADVRQIASALELYYNDKSSYPGSLNDLADLYLGTVPTAPEPPGGTCTSEQNQYRYAYYGPGEYRLTFCLGGTVGGITAGPHELTQAGIQ